LSRACTARSSWCCPFLNVTHSKPFAFFDFQQHTPQWRRRRAKYAIRPFCAAHA
jgi:hypothetical protein